LPEELLRESSHAFPGAQGTPTAPVRALKTVLRPGLRRPVEPARAGGFRSRADPDGDHPDVTFSTAATLLGAFNH
jgi:hypothetical protein